MNIAEMARDKAKAKFFREVIDSGSQDINYYTWATRKYLSSLFGIWREVRIILVDDDKRKEIDSAIGALSKRINNECIFISKGKTKCLSSKTIFQLEQVHRAILTAMQLTGLGTPIKKEVSDTKKRKEVMDGTR